MPMNLEDEALLNQMAEEVQAMQPMHLAISPIEAIRLAGLMQLVSRHPEVTGEHQFALSWFVAHVRKHFEGCPAVLEVLHRGDDRRYDRVRES